MAFNTPFKRWKSYEFNGGTAEPAGDGLEGAVAEQFSGGGRDG